MTDKRMFDAVSKIDEDLIELCLAEKPGSKTRTNIIRAVVAGAALSAVILLLAFVLPGMLHGKVNPPKQAENPAETGEVFESEKDVHNMFENMVFDHSVDYDREGRSSELMLSYPSEAYDEPTGFAVCIVTVTNIDVSSCSEEAGKRLPIQIRIDSIIGKNPAFTLDVGDTAIVAEYSSWFKNKEGYSIRFPDGIIPITEKDAQYIVIMYCADETSKEVLWTDLEYMVEALTIPIVENSDMTDDEIYALLKLPEDVIRCSKDLIAQYIVK